MPFSDRAEPEDAAPVELGLMPTQAAVTALDCAARFQALETIDRGVFDHVCRIPARVIRLPFPRIVRALYSPVSQNTARCQSTSSCHT